MTVTRKCKLIWGGRRQVVKAVDCESTTRGFNPRRSPIKMDWIHLFVYHFDIYNINMIGFD